MSDITPRLALPLIAAGQAQKEVFHNEALVRLDAVAMATVEDVGANAPPASTAAGLCYVVGSAPTGAWAGQPQTLAIATDGGWRFVAPGAGMTVRRADSGLEIRFDGSVWRVGEVQANRLFVNGIPVVGAQQPAMSAPSGGTVIDTEARAAIASLIQALETHGLLAP